jgi:tricorn protease
VLYSLYPVEGSVNQPDFDLEPKANATIKIYTFEDQKEETLLEGISDFEVSLDASMLIYRAGNRLRVLKAGEKPDEKAGNGPSRKSGWIDLNRISVPIVPAEEWRQMFRGMALQRAILDAGYVQWIGTA